MPIAETTFSYRVRRCFPSPMQWLTATFRRHCWVNTAFSAAGMLFIPKIVILVSKRTRNQTHLFSFWSYFSSYFYFSLFLIFAGLAELMQRMKSVDFGSHINRIEKLRSHCKIVILLIMHKPESDRLRSVVVTHEDQCDLLNQQMNHMELMKEQSPTVPFQELLCITTLICPWPAVFTPKNLFHSVLSASKSSNKEHTGIFWQQQPITASTSLYFSHWRTCSSLVFTEFHHIILLFELPGSLLPTLLHLKLPFHNAIRLYAGLLLVSPAGKQVWGDGCTCWTEDLQQLGWYSAGCSRLLLEIKPRATSRSPI